MLIVYRRKDGRWIVGREAQAWEKTRGIAKPHPWNHRRQLVSGGDHATAACARSWAESHLRRLEAQGFKVPELEVDRSDPPKDGRYPLRH